MKKGSVFDHQSVKPVRKLKRGFKRRSNLLVVSPSHKWGDFLFNRVKRDRRKDFLLFKRTLGQLGFGLIKMFLFLLVLGGLSLAFICAYHFLSSSPYFRLQNIVVTGVNDDLKEELIKVSGITEMRNLLSTDLAATKRNIEGHPWIKSVFLKKKFPHTLYIKAENEESMAIVLLEEKMHLMDREGIIFKEVEGDDCVDFPVVTGLSAGDKKNEAYLERVASFLDALYLGDTPLSLNELSEIHVREDGTLTVYFNKLPFSVFFGKEDFIRKIDALKHIMKHLQATHRLYQARSIDLDYDLRVVVAFTGKVV